MSFLFLLSEATWTLQGVYIIATDLLFADQYTSSVFNVVTRIGNLIVRVGIFLQLWCSLLMTRIDNFVIAWAVYLFLFRESSKVVKLNHHDFSFF